MFEKKDIIFSGSIGICKVEDIVKLSANKKDVYTYYLLRSIINKDKTSYIPVENHTVELRELITLEEAELKKATSYNNIGDHEKEEIDYVINFHKKIGSTNL